MGIFKSFNLTDAGTPSRELRTYLEAFKKMKTQNNKKKKTNPPSEHTFPRNGNIFKQGV